MSIRIKAPAAQKASIAATLVLFGALPLAACGKKADSTQAPPSASAATAQPEPCPEKFALLPEPARAADRTCSCSADATKKGTVWGDGTYTQDSSICAAAVHAGVIPATGGAVTARPSPGCGAYPGVPRNGVTSASWNRWPASFYFPAKGDGKCADLSEACPAAFKDLPDADKPIAHTCRCSPEATSAGTVWGTDMYTRDSSICSAAVHAGVIGHAGGEVKVQAAPGCPSYKGSERNGVRSAPWQKWPGSFFFAGQGAGKCVP